LSRYRHTVGEFGPSKCFMQAVRARRGGADLLTSFVARKINASALIPFRSEVTAISCAWSVPTVKPQPLAALHNWGSGHAATPPLVISRALRWSRPFGRAANMPSTRPRKPTDADMGPHNWGGGEARPKGGGRMRRRGK
jgi:hypothetical protein